MHHVYVIENENGGWYIGYSTDVRRRLSEHNAHKNISTSNVKEWKLIYCETYVEKMDALGREKFLKSGSGRGFLKKQVKHYLEKIFLTSSSRYMMATNMLLDLLVANHFQKLMMLIRKIQFSLAYSHIHGLQKQIQWKYLSMESKNRYSSCKCN